MQSEHDDDRSNAHSHGGSRRLACSSIGLGGVSPTVFVRTQCSMHHSIFLLYRLIVTSYFFGYFLYDVIVSVRPGGTYANGYYAIYLTNWSYVVTLMYLFCALWNLLSYIVLLRRSCRLQDGDIPWYFFPRGQWLLFNIYASAEILVAISYWSSYTPGIYSVYYDINFHLLPAVFALVEILLTTTVVRLLHFVYPFAFISAFVVFSGIYWAAGGTDEEGERYIYPILDYGENPGKASAVVLAWCVGVVILHIVVVWGLHRLKLACWDRCRCPSYWCCASDEEALDDDERVPLTNSGES